MPLNQLGFELFLPIESYNVSRKGGKNRNRYNQVPQQTHDTKWEIDKNTIKNTNKSQEVRWPQGSNEQTRKHEKHET